MSRLTGLLCILLGCAAPTDDTSETAQAINGDWSPASQYMLDRAVKIPHCTATRIGPRHAMTSMHCFPEEGDTVRFYTSGPGVDYAQTATIVNVDYPPGAGVAGCHDDGDCDDGNGNFADMAIIELASEGSGGADSLSGAQATLGWKYPGDFEWGKQVGAGGHNGNPNPNGILRQVSDTLDSVDDSGGSFITTNDSTDGGDSGGPFYYGSKVIGTLWGYGVDFDGEWNKYTSVPFRLDWILSKIGYSWIGLPPISGRKYNGTEIDSFAALTERVCQYACEKTTSCEAYNYRSISWSCQLVSNVSGTTASSLHHSALHYGASSGVSSAVAGYVRANGTNTVVHTTSAGRLNELWMDSNGAWHFGDLMNVPENPPRPNGKLSPYRRADGLNAVVYTSISGEIIEIALWPNGAWHAGALTGYTARRPKGDPVAYVRHDGVSAVVFRDTNDHIVELRLATEGWIAHDLTTAAGTVASSSEPSAYVRSDGYSAVVFRAGNDIIELFKGQGESWGAGNLSQTAGAPAAASRPHGYTHHDGTNAVVYRSTSNKIIELFLLSGWHAGDITSSGPAANGDPMAYVRTDGAEAVVYRTGSGEVWELANVPWQARNRSVTSYHGVAPSVYVRSDGFNEILSSDGAGHVTTASWKIGQSAWIGSDLSYAAGEP